MEYIIQRSRRKTLALQIDSLGNLLVKAPNQISIEKIEQFISQKNKWITSTVNRVRSDLLSFQPILKVEQVMLFGIRYPVILQQRKGVFFDGETFYLPIINTVSALVRWLKREATNYLETRCAELSQIYGFLFNKIQIKSYRAKWGCCNARKEISFNYRLVMINKNIIDYVILHEFCHLRILNHSPEYWKHLSIFMPNYKLCRDSLKSYNILNHFPIIQQNNL